MTETRPPLSAVSTSRELLRWYWLKTELAALAGRLGVGAGGSKQELVARVAAQLDGQARPARTVRRTTAAVPLTEPLAGTTQIPVGQQCSQQLRRYFVAAIGPSFRFDAAMRDFIAAGAGQTLEAAVDHWHATRSSPKPPIGIQFELNRFLRRWHQDHPGGSPQEARRAWRVHRARPADRRSG